MKKQPSYTCQAKKEVLYVRHDDGKGTEYCIDATCKSAFDYGYKIIIPEETNTTFDNEYLPGEKLYEFYNYKIWNKRFANVTPIEDVIKIMLEN